MPMISSMGNSANVDISILLAQDQLQPDEPHISGKKTNGFTNISEHEFN